MIALQMEMPIVLIFAMPMMIATPKELMLPVEDYCVGDHAFGRCHKMVVILGMTPCRGELAMLFVGVSTANKKIVNGQSGIEPIPIPIIQLLVFHSSLCFAWRF